MTADRQSFPAQARDFPKVWGVIVILGGAASTLIGLGLGAASAKDAMTTDVEARTWIAEHDARPITTDPKDSPHPPIAAELQRLDHDQSSQLARDRAIMAWIVGVLAADMETKPAKKSATAACAREQFRLTAQPGDYNASFDVAADTATKLRYSCK